MQLVLTQATEDTDGLPSAGEKKIYVTVGDINPFIIRAIVHRVAL